ncbi:MAG: CopG family ribbon-helix-helix protein [Rhodoferax sp.]
MTAAAVRPVTIKLDDDTKARLKALADARQRTPHWLMREAIAQYVEREDKREAFRRDTLQAWDAYRRTGMHASSAEADAWMAQLEQGQDTEPPPCHG